jgi:hypothetical protein
MVGCGKGCKMGSWVGKWPKQGEVKKNSTPGSYLRARRVGWPKQGRSEEKPHPRLAFSSEEGGSWWVVKGNLTPRLAFARKDRVVGV